MVHSNKISIHFGEDKTKSILLGNKSNFSLNITQNENDENIPGKAMTRIILKKFIGKRKFFSRQSRYLSYPLKRMLWNKLIQPHYDFACCSWYSNLSMSLKTKLQSTQNSCIRYCLRLKDKSHIGDNDFEKIN